MIDLGALQGRIQIDGMNEATSGLNDLSGGFGGAIEMAKKFAAALAIGATIKKCVGDANELKVALNSLVVETGASAEEMEGFEENLKNIYAQNYGEGFEDIAGAMANIKQQTGLVGQELEDATISAIALRDTFDWEVEESIRAADMMMKQFGISSDEACNLLAQGAQNGLDKNQNLLDSVNEYSVHFKQLGFDSEEMFNMFSNGAEAGVFDIDKLGDAVKEFGIRAQDGSNTTVLAFESLGLNADELQKRFAEGGETANLAFQEVTQALVNCDDKVVQSTAGVNLFGTMYEDLGITAISALTNVTGEIDTQKATLESIKDIKYDDFASAMVGIGRQIEVGLIIPLGENLIPYLNTLATQIQENMPDIKETMENVLDGVGKAIEFVVDNLDILIPLLSGAVAGFVAFNVISAVVSLYTTLTAILEGVSTAQGILNAVMSANPIGLIATAIGLLIGAGALLIANWDEVKEACSKLWNKLTEWFDDIADAFNEMIKNIVSFASDMYEAGVEIFNSLWEGYKQIWLNVIEWIADILSNMVNKLFGTDIDLFETGKQIFNGLWNGFKDIWNDIATWVSDKVDWLADKLTFWDNSTSKMSESDGSHRIGLDYVPYDGYSAILHKGEMVLTQAESDRYRRQEQQVQTTTNIFDTSGLEAKIDKLIKTTNNIPRQMQINANMSYKER